MVVSLLLSGCGLFGTDTVESLPIDYRDYLPQEWTPLGQWQPINIDGDGPIERLLFYHYDNGQIGAVIYDPQSDTRFVQGQSISIPNQPSAFLVPYRLLPSYWLEAGQGFIATPDQAPQLDAFEVTRQSPNELGPERLEGQADELIVLGGDTYISVFWWRGPLYGYGVAQIFAPGGFRNVRWEGQERATPIRQVDALFPQHDRSLLCKKATYTREVDESSRVPDGYRPPVIYRASPQRLVFCAATVPNQPFYPEAVALAYLLAPAQMQHLVQQELQEAVAAAVGTYDRVDALTYYDTLPVASSVDIQTEQQRRMTVIADLVEASGTTRQVTFVLAHQLPDAAARTSDRWSIVLALASP